MSRPMKTRAASQIMLDDALRRCRRIRARPSERSNLALAAVTICPAILVAVIDGHNASKCMDFSTFPQTGRANPNSRGLRQTRPGLRRESHSGKC